MIVRAHSHPLYCDHPEQQARNANPRGTSPVRGHSWSPRAPDLTRAPATGASVPMCNARHTSDTQKTIGINGFFGYFYFRVKMSNRTWGCRSPYTFPKGWVDNDDSVGPELTALATLVVLISPRRHERAARWFSGLQRTLQPCTTCPFSRGNHHDPGVRRTQCRAHLKNTEGVAGRRADLPLLSPTNVLLP